MGKKVFITVYGTEGTPILAFPGDSGSMSDWETNGLIHALSYQIENGYNRIYCVESVDNESFFNTDVKPQIRISRHRQYERYVVDEVLPFIRKTSGDVFIMAAGIHMGGYQALNLLLKHPTLIRKAISIGGRFQIRPFMGDYFDDSVYFNNPLEYLPNLDDRDLLEAIRSTDIRLIVTPDDPYVDLNYMLSDVLRSKAIEHIFDYWIETGEHPREIWGNIMQRHVP